MIIDWNTYPTDQKSYALGTVFVWPTYGLSGGSGPVTPTGIYPNIFGMQIQMGF